MSKNEIILGVAALVLIVFSLVVALVIPRRNPDFPGDRTGLFTLVAVLLVAGMLGVVEVYGAEHEGGEAAEAQGEETGEGQVEGGEGGEGEAEDGGGGGAQGDAAKGEGIFADQGCGSCHALAAAESTGAVGPNLDDAKPSFDETVKQVTEGGGGMPAFGDKLNEAEIADVSAFVVESAGG